MPSERLRVIREETVLATLERRSPDDLRLTFEPRIVEEAAGQPIVSTSLLVRAEPYRRDELLPFFEGLLPEEGARLRLARRLRLDANDVFGFLREIGRDCAGALSLVPEDLAPNKAELGQIAWLTELELAQKINELGEHPLAVEPKQNIRISLAGAQDKMAVVVQGKRIGLPRGLVPSTHILKPTSREHERGKLRFPALVANEAFSMTLAGLVGIRVPTLTIRTIARENALLIERYDRASVDGRVIRLHQEDFCQALGIRTLQKYESDGGPGVDRYLDLVRRWSSDVANDIDQLIDRVGFNYLIGNADAHAKNFSLLYSSDGIRLAPAYDILSTSLYPALSTEMATSVAGIFDAGALKPLQWRRWLKALDLSSDRYGTRLADLADRIQEALPQAHRWVQEAGIEDRRLRKIDEIVAERAKRLSGLRRASAA
jgi:serine/threonine-protein kinase HipA